MAVSIKKLEANIKRSLPAIQELVANSHVVSVQDTLGLMLQRIFNRGEDAMGNPIGKYSTNPDGSDSSYIKRRQKKGLQTNYIDLQFEGNLFRSVDVGTSNDVPCIGITNSKSADVSEDLEIKLGTGPVPRNIFTPSQSEIDNASRVATDYLIDGLKGIIASWGK